MSFWSDFSKTLVGFMYGDKIKTEEQALAERARLQKSITDPLKGTAKMAKGIPGLVTNKLVVKPIVENMSQGLNEADAAAVSDLYYGSAIGKFAAKGTEDVLNGAPQAFDPVLQLGEKAEKYVFSPIIARPISTLNLLSDPTSKLYQNGQFGEGFQFSDITAAYNRTGNEYKTVDGEQEIGRAHV